MNSKGLAQQDSQFTQYMYNTQAINSAYAGNRGLLSLFGSYRAQWVGLDGAPTTMYFTANSPLGRNVGFGLTALQDEIGPSTESLVATDFSYTIRVKEYLKLAFGLKGGLQMLNVDLTKLNQDPNDPNTEPLSNNISPVVGVGFYLHHTDKWYIGLSSPNLLSTKHYKDLSVSVASERMHIYLMGGYVFDLNYYTKFKPAILTKATAGSPLSVDLSANFLFHEKFTAGVAYKWNAAISAMVGFKLSDSMFAGYAYDYDTTELGKYNSGSHELFLRFDLFTRVRNKINPRFF